MNISEQIRNYRKSVGLTQEQVANALGVSASAVNKWEKFLSRYLYTTGTCQIITDGYERAVFFPGRIDRQGDWTVC